MKTGNDLEPDEFPVEEFERHLEWLEAMGTALACARATADYYNQAEEGEGEMRVTDAEYAKEHSRRLEELARDFENIADRLREASQMERARKQDAAARARGEETS